MSLIENRCFDSFLSAAASNPTEHLRIPGRKHRFAHGRFRRAFQVTNKIEILKSKFWPKFDLGWNFILNLNSKSEFWNSNFLKNLKSKFRFFVKFRFPEFLSIFNQNQSKWMKFRLQNQKIGSNFQNFGSKFRFQILSNFLFRFQNIFFVFEIFLIFAKFRFQHFSHFWNIFFEIFETFVVRRSWRVCRTCSRISTKWLPGKGIKTIPWAASGPIRFWTCNKIRLRAERIQRSVNSSSNNNRLETPSTCLDRIN